ncbi:hypothetical protein ES702_02323 [subsurface metagenome]
MQEIENHNCVGICCQRFCSNSETNFINLSIHGFNIVVSFCKEHAEEFENILILESKKKQEELKCQQN